MEAADNFQVPNLWSREARDASSTQFCLVASLCSGSVLVALFPHEAGETIRHLKGSFAFLQRKGPFESMHRIFLGAVNFGGLSGRALEHIKAGPKKPLGISMN